MAITVSSSIFLRYLITFALSLSTRFPYFINGREASQILGMFRARATYHAIERGSSWMGSHKRSAWAYIPGTRSTLNAFGS